MPVITRRTSLEPAHEPAGPDVSSNQIRTGHRRFTSVTAPRLAAITLSVGLTVGALAAAPAADAEAATTATYGRGNQPIGSRPWLRYGDSGSAVRYVQVTLRRAHLPAPVSSWYGAATRKAVSDLQRAIGLYPSGTVDYRTWSALYKISRYGWRAPTARTFHKRVLQEAAKLRGAPYRAGGTSPRGFDCSGFTRYVYRKAGKALPRTSRGQYRATRHITRRVARPGDLVFFVRGGRVHHVGIYAGGNTLWHSSRSGQPVAKSRIWSSRIVFGRR